MRTLTDYAEPTETGLYLNPQMPYEAWAALGEKIAAASLSYRWWIGDWVNFGETIYGEKYAQALDATGLDYKSLANSARVSRRVAPKVRKGLPLYWSHHEEIAVFEDPATQTVWLDRAIREKWSSKDLRRAIRAAKIADKGLPPERAPGATPAITVTVDQVRDAIRTGWRLVWRKGPAQAWRGKTTEPQREAAGEWLAAHVTRVLWAEEEAREG